MTPALFWGRFPSDWVYGGGLKAFSWKTDGSAGTAALRLYTVLAHWLQEDDGIVRVSYDTLMPNANLSRESVSRGLDLLQGQGLIERGVAGRSSFRFRGYDPKRGWAKLPARRLYQRGTFVPFSKWTMRGVAELDAIKLYLFIAACRDNEQNATFTNYIHIKEGAAIPSDPRITGGLSLLTVSGLLYTTELAREGYGYSRSYRLIGLDSHRHGGTTGRADTPVGTASVPF
jgi:hypothetical protein